MKQISLIIPFLENAKRGSPSSHTSSKKILSVIRNIHAKMQHLNITYEIIVVTDRRYGVTLKDIEIYPVRTPIRLYKKVKHPTISELIIKGIKLAEYEDIGIIGGVNEFSPNIIKRITSQKKEKKLLIASVKINSPKFLPYFLKMRISPETTALFFSKHMWDVIHFTPESEHTFFLECIRRSQQAGFLIKKYRIFSSQNGSTTLTRNDIKEYYFAAKDVVQLELKKVPPIYIPAKKGSMINAGLFYKKHEYITHTTLKIYQSALDAVNIRVVIFVLVVLLVSSLFLFESFLFFLQSLITLLSLIYLIDVCFNMFLVLKTFQHAPELSFTEAELSAITNEGLPTYSILCPLYKETHILPQFISGLEKIDWPKNKLDVIILFESDDLESIEAFEKMDTPSYIRSIVVPNSNPKTKPKACNYGLAFATGEFTVIYDAEDIPDPLQLKKAYLGFQQSGSDVACLQAKLNFYNVNQNLLTRLFTAEYALWFDLMLTSLHTLNSIIPLGGTSNHFRTDVLTQLHAWDPFNVTEDADLGMRLFKLGYRTVILDSVTLEEGNSQVKNWIRQRSRWIKGYMQTYLVHAKESYSFFLDRGYHVFVFHLVIGGKLAFIIINPILWIITILYFAMHPFFGPIIDSLYPAFVLYIAMTSLIFGNALYLFCYLMACVKREHWGLIKYMIFVPFYWILISIAGFVAAYQLLFKPFYWEKTTHGLHLKNQLSFNPEPSKVV